MKRIVCILLVLAMLLGSVTSLASCDKLIGYFGEIPEGSTEDNGDSSDDDHIIPGELPDESDDADIPKVDDEDPDNEKDSPEEIIPDDNESSKEEEKPGEGDKDPEVGDNNSDEDNKDSTDKDNAEDGNDPEEKPCVEHTDKDSNDYCDICNDYLIVVIDFYVFNDLHGKFCDTSTQPGVDELGTYFYNMSLVDDNMVILSSGDMWQGSAESTLTNGKILVDWMNLIGFEAMTLGNHEFDWGEDAIRTTLTYATFPFLAINVYDNTTGKLADYCTPSIMIERDGIKIGIIGAVGDCYSSISSNMVENVSFKVGSQLTALVKAESERLRELGADLIVYSLHDGEGSSSYYDYSLSNGYVDIVFEAQTHQDYVTVDSYGVYHLQGGGENYGLSHLEIAINSVNGNNRVTASGIITTSAYKNLEDHPETEAIEDSYSEIIEYAYADLGVVSKTYSDSEIEDFVAQLYLEAGLEKWGGKYNIVLGGGFLKTRTPYNLTAGIKKYADVLSLFPFNNQLVLCSISGNKLRSKFIETTNSDYHIALSSYGSSLNISNNGRYYVIVDMYTAVYSSNGLTIVDYYDDGVYARDLLADAIVEGRLQSGGIFDDNYTLTSIPDALSIGKRLSSGSGTTEYYYVKGTVSLVENTTYGNLYIVDEKGNEIYIYGLYDAYGNRYDAMTYKPQVGDSIVVYSIIYKYGTTVELKNANIVEIE